uniref:RNA helicase n=1 Tax=Globisporangium ultimum (strain ATCC 200006 / CBS 805.95 / DAOM BR144) TaxID=431595 RepID=K3WEU5_GLOUD
MSGSSVVAAETGFEFPREHERTVHEQILPHVRVAQRVRFRPGVTAAGAAVDVIRQERSAKKIAKVFKTLQDEYGFADADDAQSKHHAMLVHALQHCNKLEDALQFLALQYTSDELPAALRARPHAGNDGAPRRSNDGEDAGELVVTVNSAANALVNGEEDGDTANDVNEVKPQVESVADHWEDVAPESAAKEEDAETSVNESKNDALSWTQQYLQVIAEREAEEARQAAAFAKLSPEAKALLALEEQYTQMLAVMQQAKEQKSMTKKKQKALAQELQLLRLRLVERGWDEAEYHARMVPKSNSNDAQNDSKKDKKIKSPPKENAALPTAEPDADNESVHDGAESSRPATDNAEEDDDEYGGAGLFGGADSDDDETANAATSTPSSRPAPSTTANELQSTEYETPSEDAQRSQSKKNTKAKYKQKQMPKSSSSSTSTATWTGKTPRDHIQDYCKKRKLPRPIYKKLSVKGRTHLYTLVLDMKTHKREFVVPDHCGGQIGFPTIDEAKDTVSTHALYDLSPDLPLHLVLPPLYRDMWLEWVRAKEQEAADAVADEKAGFDAIVKRIYDEIPNQLAAKVIAVASGESEAVGETKVKSKESAGQDENESESSAPAAVLDDWSVDDWDADLSDAESEHNGTTASTAAASTVGDDQEQEEEEVDPAVQAFSQSLKRQLEGNMRSKAYKDLWRCRQQLPITSFKDQVLDALKKHNVILISGETGCGKSTQVPQFLLEDTLLRQECGATCNIVCTQPRRLAAISLAERVSQELGEAPSSMGTGDSLCGYQIRLENRMTKHTRLLFCTTGILLRKLQNPATLETEISHIIVDEVHERDLQNDVLLSMLRQFLANANNNGKRRRSPVKVILMSATLNAASFQQYFGGASVCPMLSVPGRTFPVQEFFLEDVLEKTEYVIDESSPAYVPFEAVQQSTQIKVSGRGGTSYSQKVFWEASSTKASHHTKSHASGGKDGNDQEEEASPYSERTLKSLDRIDPSVINYDLIQDLIERLVHNSASDMLTLSDTLPSASILVFLPGLQEISTLLDLLGGHREFSDERKYSLLPLHSSLSPQDQQRIFQMPRGIVRIIATTNIAETSLTVEDVKIVIDSGRVKEMRHNSTQRTNVLDEIWISRANAKQRMGRAGRTSGGVCYRLFPMYIYKSVMDEQPVPEIKRAPLTSLCLQIKTFGVATSCSEFLGGCLDPPEEASIRDALHELFEIGALDPQEETLTTLGCNLARLPVDVKVGKMLLLAALFNVFDPISTCAAILETKSPFVAPYGHQAEMQAARKRFAVGQSDLLTDVNAYEAWRTQFLYTKNNSNKKAEREFCRQHFLSHRSLKEITKLKQQFYNLVAQPGYLPKQQQQWLTKAEDMGMLCAILYAGLAPNLVHVERAQSDSKRLVLRDQDHTTVVVHPSSINYKHADFTTPFLTYPVKLHTSQIYLPTSSIVTPAAVCLFSHSLEILAQVRATRGKIGLRINEWVMFQSSYRSAVLLQELRQVVLEFIADRLENPPFLQRTSASPVESPTISLTPSLHALLASEYEQLDPKHALTKQLCSATTKK